MEKVQNIRLTSTEMGLVWTTYINDTMAKCVLSYFMNTAEDPEVKGVVEAALGISDRHIQELQNLFNDEKFPIPRGFTDEDVNLNAKRLFSDTFFLYYIKNMAKVGLATYSMGFSMAARQDIRSFFGECVSQTISLDQQITVLLQSKGLYIRAPYIPKPDEIDFVDSTRFLSGGFFGFVDTRPLLSIEIAHLFSNIQTNSLGRCLLIGFCQCAQSHKLKKFFKKGIEMSGRHISDFADILTKEQLSTPMTWDTDALDSTDPPFSDKLMLFHVSLLVAAGFGNYSVAAAASPRRDVAATYAKLAVDIAQYATEGAKLMIEHGWMEEPPTAPDRKELQKV